MWPTRRKKAGSSLMASANWKRVSSFMESEVEMTCPFFLDHILDLLDDRSFGVVWEVEQNTQGSDLPSLPGLELAESLTDGHVNGIVVLVGHGDVDVTGKVSAIKSGGKVGIHIERVVVDVQFVVADGHNIVRDLLHELICVVSIDTADGETVGEAGTVVQIARVDDEQVDVLLLRNVLHVLDERGKVAEVTRVVRLRE
jgi:hypothetical protein